MAVTLKRKTVDNGFMARHLIHYAKPNYPTFAAWKKQIAGVDNEEKSVFIQRMENLWTRIGVERKDPENITRYKEFPLVRLT